MADALAAPVLESTIDRLLVRERRGRRDAALRRAIAATAAALAVAAAWRIADRVMGRAPMPVAQAAGLVGFVAAVGLAFAVRGAVGRSAHQMAREMDRRLGLDDRASAALAVLRGGVTSRLAAYVVGDAEWALRETSSQVDKAFPAKAGRRVTAPVRWLGIAALLAVVLAIVAELLTLEGPIRLLPGISHGGAEPRTLVPPTEDAPHRDGAGPARAEGPHPSAPEPAKRDTPKPPPPAAPKGDVRVAIKMAKDEFESDEPLAATVAATATGELGGPRGFDVRIAVDGIDVDTGVRVEVDPSRPQGERAEFDLKHVPGLKLTPGEHVATATLTTRTSHEEHMSAPVKFHVRPPKDDSDPSDPKKKDQPATPKPQASPQPEPRPGDPEKKQDEPSSPSEPPPAPPVMEKHVVVPLFGEGETVRKKGLILVLDPGGGTGAPPQRRPIDEALAAAKRRAEEAVDRAGVRAEDRELVRRYFELIEALRR